MPKESDLWNRNHCAEQKNTAEGAEQQQVPESTIVEFWVCIGN